MKIFACEIRYHNRINSAILSGESQKSVAEMIHSAMRNFGYVEMLKLGEFAGIPICVEKRYGLIVKEVGEEFVNVPCVGENI